MREPMTAEDLIHAAEEHGQESDTDHEVGDLQAALRYAWCQLTRDQKLKVEDVLRSRGAIWKP